MPPGCSSSQHLSGRALWQMMSPLTRTLLELQGVCWWLLQHRCLWGVCVLVQLWLCAFVCAVGSRMREASFSAGFQTPLPTS